MTTFADLGLAEPFLKALVAQGYEAPTPIQEQAIPPLLAGRDVLGLAQTGTGKTAAFALPMLTHLSAEPRRRPQPRAPRALVLTPTRELAIQVAESFVTLGQGGGFRVTAIFGGVGQNPQVAALMRGLDVLVATPGRLLDLMNQGHVDLRQVEILVLDEADRMLDMGFVRDVRKIVAQVPAKRRTLLFSATLPDSVAELAAGLLTNPVRVAVTPPSTTVERVDQRVLFVDRADKPELLRELFRDGGLAKAIVFTRTKHGANKVAERLAKAGIAAEAIHGNKSQNARQRALDAFKAGRVRALVATDIAARGLDVEAVSHVINFELPDEPEAYVHRIGRTARAGRDGVALSFCEAEEVGNLRDIERTIRQPVPVDATHSFHSDTIAQMHRTGRGGTTTRHTVPRGRPAQAQRSYSAPRQPSRAPGAGAPTTGRSSFGAPSSSSRPAFRSGSR